jgi:hypothetical protein
MLLGFLMILAGVIALRLVVVLDRRARERKSPHDEQYEGFLRFLARVRAASLARHR